MQLANLYIQLYTIHKIFVKKNPEAFSMTFFLTSGQIGLILKSSVINLGTLLIRTMIDICNIGIDKWLID